MSNSPRQNIESNSTTLFNSIIASAMDAMITIDSAQKNNLFNATAEKMFDYPVQEVLGKPLDILPQNLLTPITSRAIGNNHDGSAIINFTLPKKGISLETMEYPLVQQAIEQCHRNQTHAAKLLGISRDQLRYRQKKLQG